MFHRAAPVLRHSFVQKYGKVSKTMLVRIVNLIWSSIFCSSNSVTKYIRMLKDVLVGLDNLLVEWYTYSVVLFSFRKLIFFIFIIIVIIIIIYDMIL